MHTEFNTSREAKFDDYKVVKINKDSSGQLVILSEGCIPDDGHYEMAFTADASKILLFPSGTSPRGVSTYSFDTATADGNGKVKFEISSAKLPAEFGDILRYLPVTPEGCPFSRTDDLVEIDLWHFVDQGIRKESLKLSLILAPLTGVAVLAVILGSIHAF